VGAQQAPPYAPRKKSRLGKILLILFAIVVVVGVGTGIAVYYGVKKFASSVKSSEAYRVAESELRSSSAVTARLGEIKEVGFPLGTYSEEPGGTGKAAFTTSVEGTKGSGRYVVALEREGGKWHVKSGFVTVNGSGEMINIADSGSDSPYSGTVEAPPPPQPEDPPAAPKPPGKKAIVSGGVLNGKAISKPQPPYPAIAKAARAQGTVTVQIVVDETGRVVSASAVGGHPLLQQAAVGAARQARFSPTLLSGQPVKVSGVITYNFVLQ
jgi:TonB family protein